MNVESARVALIEALTVAQNKADDMAGAVSDEPVADGLLYRCLRAETLVNDILKLISDARAI